MLHLLAFATFTPGRIGSSTCAVKIQERKQVIIDKMPSEASRMTVIVQELGKDLALVVCHCHITLEDCCCGVFHVPLSGDGAARILP